MTTYNFLRQTTLGTNARKKIGPYRARRRNPAEALPRNPTEWQRGQYNGAELQPDPSIPPQRMAAYHLPSRVGDRLYWPGGRVTGLNGNEVTA